MSIFYYLIFSLSIFLFSKVKKNNHNTLVNYFSSIFHHQFIYVFHSLVKLTSLYKLHNKTKFWKTKKKKTNFLFPRFSSTGMRPTNLTRFSTCSCVR